MSTATITVPEADYRRLEASHEALYRIRGFLKREVTAYEDPDLSHRPSTPVGGRSTQEA